ncbi:hypothetical protein Droror1_Dr00008460 [Drosera rotundifolia]
MKCLIDCGIVMCGYYCDSVGLVRMQFNVYASCITLDCRLWEMRIPLWVSRRVCGDADRHMCVYVGLAHRDDDDIGLRFMYLGMKRCQGDDIDMLGCYYIIG